MKTYQLNKGYIELPDTWEDLTFKQKLFAFENLLAVSEGRLHPFTFRLLMLGHITGYKPQSGFLTWMVLWMLFLLRIPFVALYYIIKLGKIRFSGYWNVWSSDNRPQRRNREVINLNLVLLSEKLDFAFTLDEYTVKWNRRFIKNPIPYFKIQGRKFTGRKFIMDIAPFTNITAKEYCDCYDLYLAYYNTQDPVIKEKCLDKLVSILYPATDDYRENMVSAHTDLISSISPGLKFGILFWFSGIIEFYTNHPIYSILFRKEKNNTDSISVGMNEIVLMIERKGYDPNCNLNDFFDKQINILKDNLSEAIAKGAKVEELSNKTGLSINIINKLVG